MFVEIKNQFPLSQTTAIQISQSESESASLRENLKVRIRQKETIREVEPTCACKQPKEKVFVNRAKPLYVTGKSRRVVVPASEPIVVKPAPVVIRQKADVEVRPIHITKQPPPLIVTKKIVKLHQPIVKKFYVESYRKHEEGGPAHIVSQKVSKKTCNCPTSEHVISSKYHWSDSSPMIENQDQGTKVLRRGNDEVEAEFDVEEGDF